MKRLFITIGTLAAFVGLAHATITRVQSASGNTAGAVATSFTMTFGSTPTVGNWMVGCVGLSLLLRVPEITIGGATVGAYTVQRYTGVVNGTSGHYSLNFMFPVTASATTVVTVSLINGSGSLAGAVAEYSADRGLFPDRWISATGTGTAVTTGTTGTTNFPVELLVGCAEQRGQFSSAQTGWLTSITGSFGSVLQTSTTVNSANQDVSIAMLDRIVSSTGTFVTGGTSGTSQQYEGVLNGLYEPTATPTSTPTVTPTATFTPTPVPTCTATATPTATSTATATATATATSTNTPTPTVTPTSTPTPTPIQETTSAYQG